MLAQEEVQEAIEGGILDPIKHERIIGNIDKLAARSRMPQQALVTSLKGLWNKAQIEKLVKLRKMCGQGKGTGFYCIGQSDAIDKFQALCGFLLRNFMDGVMIPAHEVILKTNQEVVKDCQVLLIPDLYREASGAGSAAWKADVLKLISVIDSRRMLGKVTIIHIDNMVGVKESFGEIFAKTLENNFYKL